MNSVQKITCMFFSFMLMLLMLAGCGNNQGRTEENREEHIEKMEENARDTLDKLEIDSTLQSIRVVVDGIVNKFDVMVADGAWYISAEDAQMAFDSSFDEQYVNLDAYAKDVDIRYEQDTVLNAAYFSTYEPYDGINEDFNRAIALGLVSEDVSERKEEQIRTTEFRAMLTSLIEQLAPEQISYFDQNVTDHDELMHRGSGFIMAYYAAECIGANYFNNHFDNTRADGGDFWEVSLEDLALLYPNLLEGPVQCGWRDGLTEESYEWADTLTAAYLYSFWHSSPVSDELLFAFDEEASSMHQKEPLTVEAAVCVVARLYDTIMVDKMGYADIDSDIVLSPNSSIITSQMITKANAAPLVTAENHPEWTGLVIGSVYDRNLLDESKKIQKIADWGFNSARIVLDYETLFNYDVTQANTLNLELIDKAIAAAINNNVHLNLCFTTNPGRTAYINPDHTSTGEFDLFLNPEKQEVAYRMWDALAQRYKDVPSAYLSFTPIWESDNYNLSTGLPYPEYSMADAGRYMANVTDRIHALDADRLLVLEVCTLLDDRVFGLEMADFKAIREELGDRQNVIYSFNFVEEEYVYANMTATEGEHIDVNNHSFYLVDYPTVNYGLSPFVIDMESSAAYNIPRDINWDDQTEKNLILEGCLPAGTTIDIYLSETYGGAISFTADGTQVHREELDHSVYERSELLSAYIRYATTDKKVQVTLTEDVDQLVVSAEGGAFEWAGMDVILPEEYTRERWYLVTGYDVYEGLAEEEGAAKKSTSTVMIWPQENDEGRKITVNEDLSYQTDVIYSESSLDTIRATMEACVQYAPGSIIRFEDACFAAVTVEGELRYYEDLLTTMNEYGFNWWSNDWYAISGQRNIVDAKYVPYNGVVENLYVELLELLQQYQKLEHPYRGR